MDLREAKAIILRLLQSQGKAKNSEMIQAIGGDAALFGLVREDLIFNDLAEDKKNVGLVYLGPGESSSGPAAGEVKKPSTARALTASPTSLEATKTPTPVTSKPAAKPTIERGIKPSIETRPATPTGAEGVTKPAQSMAVQIKKDVGPAYLGPGASARGLRVRKPITIQGPEARPVSGEAEKTPVPPTSKSAIEPMIEKATRPSVDSQLAAQSDANETMIEKATKPSVVTQPVAQPEVKEVKKPAHLLAAQKWTELAHLLADFNFIRDRCASGMIKELIEDFSAAVPALRETMPVEAQALFLIQGVLQLSAPILAQDSTQLASQLVGRLLAFKHEAGASTLILSLLERAQAWREVTWLRPISPTLTPPGGALLRNLTGHNGKITALAMTADGQRLISASEDQTLRVWDLERGAELNCLRGHTQKILAVAVTPDGRKAISASSDKTLKVWDISTLTPVGSGFSNPGELHTLLGHSSQVNTVAVTMDGRLAISGSSDRSLKVWDLESGVELRSLRGHADDVEKVVITPDGRRVVSASGDKTIRVWDIKSGEQLHNLHGPQSIITILMLALDGRWIISSSFEDQTIKIWDIESGKLLHTLRGHNSFIAGFAIAPDEQLAVSASGDWTLKLWDFKKGCELRTLKGHTASVRAVAITPDGRWAASGSGDKTIKLWDLQSGSELCTYQGHTDSVNFIAITPDRRRLISTSNDNTIKIWDIPIHLYPGLKFNVPGRPVLCHADSVNALIVTPDGRQLISASSDATLKLWDLASGKELLTFQSHPAPIYAVAVTPDGKRVVASGYGIKVWKLDSNTEVLSFVTPDWIYALAVTPDGQWVIAGSNEHTLKVWELTSGRELGVLGIPRSRPSLVQSIAVTPDGRRAISAALDKTLKVWDLKGGRELGTWRGHADRVTAVAVTPDGQRAISASADQTIKIWDLATGKVTVTLNGHTAAVKSIAISPDGRQMVSTGEDKTVKVWELASGKVLASFIGDGKMLACAVSKDDKIIVSAGESGWVHFLRLEGAN
jgi:WD40 repeat protein